MKVDYTNMARYLKIQNLNVCRRGLKTQILKRNSLEGARMVVRSKASVRSRGRGSDPGSNLRFTSLLFGSNRLVVG